jgi:sarcosine oxidase, subunit gamma
MADPAFPPLAGATASLRLLPPRARLSLRCGPALLPSVGAAFGAVPPTTPLASAAAGDRAALWLGPDEWLLLAEDGAAPAVTAALGAALAGAPASLVDVSHRHRAFGLAGPGAATLLNEGCPLDLDDVVFPAGACTRTLFGKIEILLWRPATAAAPGFQVEVPRSFAAPLWGLLAEVLADLEAGEPPPPPTPA